MKRTRRWYLLAGGLILAGLILIAVLAPYITPVSPDYRDTGTVMVVPPFPPSAKHWLGTDQFGRDVWSRIAYGARWSLLFAGLITAARLALALPLGYAAALHRKTAGWLVARLYVLTGAIPPLVIYLFVLRTSSARLLGLWPCFAFTVILLALVEWPRLAVFFQGRLETLLEQPFIEGAVAAGGTPGHIYRQHLRPHLWPLALQMAAQELGRVLLVLGELGVFGIFAGGGIMEPTDGSAFVIVSGVAEWGSMLADTRAYILRAPAAVFAPAIALFLAIAAANWLAQGLEGVSFPLTRWQQATTGRLSRRWRLAWVPVGVLAVLWLYQGAPWGQAQSVQAVFDRQMAALRAGDVAAYMADVAPGNPDFRLDRERWAGSVTSANWDQTVGEFRGLYAAYGKATAYFRMPRAPLFPWDPGSYANREVRLERRWGRWYEVGVPMHAIRGYHVTLETQYATLDPYSTAAQGRYLEITLTQAADRVYERVAQLIDLRGARRPVVRLYPTANQFAANIAPAAGANVWYVPGKAILVTPDFMKVWNKSRFEGLLAQELIKLVTPPGQPMSPLALGILTREADGRAVFRPELGTLAGTELSGLDGLFRITPDGLTPAQQDSLVTQSALLVDFLGQWLPPERIEELARTGAGLAEVEQATGVPLQAAYADWLYQRVAAESIMTVPAARHLVPPALLAQVAARAAGKPGYELLVLNVESQKDDLAVFLLERDGSGARVLNERWPAGS